MTIGLYTPYEGDLANGYTVGATDWNGWFDSLSQYLNTQVQPAVLALQTATAIGAQSICNGRLTLQTGNPYPPDQSNVSNVYFTSTFGSQIGLYNGSVWQLFPITTDLVWSVTSTLTCDLVDFFVYQIAGSLLILANPYTTVTATSNPVAGSNQVISINNTSNMFPGDVIGISSGNAPTATWEFCCITAINNNVSITVDYLQQAYTTPTIHLANQPTAQSVIKLNGVPVLQSDNTKRYIGTACVINGTVTNQINQRCLANLYNRNPVQWFGAPNAAVTQPISSNTWLSGSKSFAAASVSWVPVVTPWGGNTLIQGTFQFFTAASTPTLVLGMGMNTWTSGTSGNFTGQGVGKINIGNSNFSTGEVAFNTTQGGRNIVYPWINNLAASTAATVAPSAFTTPNGAVYNLPSTFFGGTVNL